MYLSEQIFYSDTTHSVETANSVSQKWNRKFYILNEEH